MPLRPEVRSKTGQTVTVSAAVSFPQFASRPCSDKNRSKACFSSRRRVTAIEDSLETKKIDVLHGGEHDAFEKVGTPAIKAIYIS